MTKAIETLQHAADAILLAARPPQGCWKENDYLWLTDRRTRLVELADGCIEELPAPTDGHQSTLLNLFRQFDQYVLTHGGVALVAPLILRIREGLFREPDLMLLRDARDTRRQDRYWLGADLVAEVVSPDDPDRDYGRKRTDYAEAGIPEYWIVDPRQPEITVLTLGEDGYIDRVPFGLGDFATSSVLDGFSVAVSTVFETRTVS
ncbi:MAG: Uma2 family endonuclease [Gammaproteobacteria bacterium]|nr:Uma2 family endonuclease [Gammaproteobacteria bacterium]MYF10757.1 Uma2 family endonuclease [Gammaproteobacteria bacterium]MYG13577.1 Uma2 family endonuclease [Gammaproteobacteria bacterium]MYK27678.1 Uma2 family endonuclease [Gammaproteobacteria bacterium]